MWNEREIKASMEDMEELVKKCRGKINIEQHCEGCWNEVKQYVGRPVLGTWFVEHFPSPDLWYEAKLNFMKSSAVWSVIGNIIGLGDRHS